MIQNPPVSAGIAEGVPWYITTATSVTGTNVTLTAPTTGQTFTAPCGRGTAAPAAGATVLVLGNGDGSNDVVMGWVGAPAGAPAATHVYVCNYFSSTVSKVDIATFTQTATLNIGGYPLDIVTDPQGKYLYATSRGNTTPSTNIIAKIDVATFTEVASMSPGYYPTTLTIDPSGTNLYVANPNSNTVEKVDVASFSVVASLAVAANIFSIAIDPAGAYAYVCSTSTITKVDLSTFTAVGTVAVTANAYAMAIDSTGTYGYVASSGNVLTKIALSTLTVSATLPSGFFNFPTGIVIDGTDTYVYLVNNSSATVSEVNVNTMTVTATGSTGGLGSQYLAIDRAAGHLYVSNTQGTDYSQNGPLARFTVPGLTGLTTTAIGQHADGIALA